MGEITHSTLLGGTYGPRETRARERRSNGGVSQPAVSPSLTQNNAQPYSQKKCSPVEKIWQNSRFLAHQEPSGQDAAQICGAWSTVSRALHSAARSDRTAAPTPPSVLFAGGAVRDHAELSARAAVGGWAPHNRHLLNTPNAACAKQQQCCARQSRSTPARAGAARRPSCTATAAPRASA